MPPGVARISDPGLDRASPGVNGLFRSGFDQLRRCPGPGTESQATLVCFVRVISNEFLAGNGGLEPRLDVFAVFEQFAQRFVR